MCKVRGVCNLCVCCVSAAAIHHPQRFSSQRSSNCELIPLWQPPFLSSLPATPALITLYTRPVKIQWACTCSCFSARSTLYLFNWSFPLLAPRCMCTFHWLGARLHSAKLSGFSREIKLPAGVAATFSLLFLAPRHRRKIANCWLFLFRFALALLTSHSDCLWPCRFCGPFFISLRQADVRLTSFFVLTPVVMVLKVMCAHFFLSRGQNPAAAVAEKWDRVGESRKSNYPLNTCGKQNL